LNKRLIGGLLLIAFCIALHELGHAFAMHFAGVPIKEISFGFGPQLFYFPGSLNGDNINFVIRLIPLGAFVGPDMSYEEMIQNVPAFKHFFINGMGIWVNVTFGYVLLFFVHVVHRKNKFLTFTKNRVLLICLLIGILGAVDFIAELGFFWKYGMICLSTLVLFLLTRNLIRKSNSVISPVRIFRMVKRSESFWEILHVVGNISIGLAGVNILPFIPFDGGHNIQYLLIESPTLKLWHRNLTSIIIIVLWAGYMINFRKLFRADKKRNEGSK